MFYFHSPVRSITALLPPMFPSQIYLPHWWKSPTRRVMIKLQPEHLTSKLWSWTSVRPGRIAESSCKSRFSAVTIWRAGTRKVGMTTELVSAIAVMTLNQTISTFNDGFIPSRSITSRRFKSTGGGAGSFASTPASSSDQILSFWSWH